MMIPCRQKYVIYFLAFVLQLCLLLPCNALSDDASIFTTEGETVTIANIDYNNFITKESDGSYSGYGADYLAKIAAITHWKYTFLDMDWPTAYESVKNGDIDFYCVARQTEDRHNSFDFSLYPICNEEMNLYTLQEKDIYYEDYAAFNGLKIGMLKQSGEIDFFNEYAKRNGFTFELVEYPRNEAAVNALKNGEVDAIALVNYSVAEDFKLIGNFGVSPAYMMSKEKSLYMKDFCKAQEQLYFSNPELVKELEEKYYVNANSFSNILLTRKEVDYIERTKQVTIALSDNLAPIEYFDKNTKSYRGVTVDILNEITKMTGLQFCYTKRLDRRSVRNQFSENQIQLIGASAQNDNTAKLMNIQHSKPFTDSAFLLVSQKTEPITPDSVVAIPRNYLHFETTAKKDGYKNFAYYESQEECIKAVYQEKANLTYIISMCQSYLLSHVEYSDLRTTILNNSTSEICFGLSQNNDNELLLSIINDSLKAIPTKKINGFIIANTIQATPSQTASDFFMKNFIWLMGFILLIGIVYVFSLIRRQKDKHQRELNKKIKIHHDFLQHLYDTLPCGFFQYSFDFPHKIIGCNRFCAKLYGTDTETVFLNRIPEFLGKKGNEATVFSKFGQCLNANEPIFYTGEIAKKDGTTAYTDCIMYVVETEQGKIFQEVCIDSTERIENEILAQKRYLKELNITGNKEQNLLYISCLDITDQILISTDIDIPSIKPGMTIEEFTHCLDFELDELQTKEALNKIRTMFTIERLSADYDEGNFEHSFNLCRKNNNKIQWLKANLVLRTNPKNGHLMCFDYIRDVTDEEIIKDIAHRLAFSGCEYFICIYIPTKSCLEYKVEDLKTITRKDTVYGENDSINALIPFMTEKSAAAFTDEIQLSTVLNQLSNTSIYKVYATLNEDSENRQDKSLTFFESNRKHDIVFVSVADVTQVRASEVLRVQTLTDALTVAEEADIAKSQFLSRVSHELRTPLNAIIGFIELAKEAIPEKKQEYLISCDIASKQLLNTINDVLDMSSINSGKLHIEKTSFNFKKLISSISTIYGAQCNQKRIDFKVMFTTPVNDMLIGDELRVNQILMNILGNAIKFTTAGHIWLSISETNIDDTKSFIRFTVSDTGCGMSNEMKTRLFKPFEQESVSTARKYGGSGLGLSIVKNLISLMNGSITVESEQGKGTDFIVEIPFQKSNVVEHSPLSRTTEDENAMLSYDFAERRILLVEDNTLNQIVASGYLSKLNLLVEIAQNGKEAVDLFLQSDSKYYKAILMDIQMPIMDGFEATKMIRESNHHDAKTIPIIAQTADAFNDDIAKSLSAGMNAHISKPIQQDSLAKTLYNIFKENTDD